MTDSSTGTTLSPGKSLLFPLAGVALLVVAALLMAAAGFGTRLGFWHFRTGFDLLRYGVYSGSAAIVVALAATAYSFRRGHRLGLLVALLALAGAGALTAVPVSWKVSAGRLPRIHDITTDITNPPAFVAVIPLREGSPNPAGYGGPEIATLQRQGYPDIKTVVLDLPMAAAFEKALATARSMGWQVVATAPLEGRIEATDTTFWFGFKDDIVIRVAPAGNRSLVDIRSVSRVGLSDVGTNARRIRSFTGKLTG